MYIVVPVQCTRRGGGDEKDGDQEHGKGPGRCRTAARSSNHLREETTMTREEIAARAQAGLWKVVGILLRVEDVLGELANGMPESPEDMLEDRRPEDTLLAVESAIRCAVADDLWPMMERLKRAAGVTAADLLKEWEERERMRVN
jgi:uncharacterized protein (DUF433 family)